MNKENAKTISNARISNLIYLQDANISSYKIGKTRQNLDERFNSGYSDEYDEIKQIFESDDTNLIDWLEEELIRNYINKSKCDNDQIGGGPSGATKIYIVIKYKK